MPMKCLLAVLAFGLVGVACGGVPSASPDAGRVDSGAAPDAATGTVDAGAPDTGTGGVDTGTGGVDTGAGGACTNVADMALLASIDIGMVVGDCAMTTFGAEPATSECIMRSGLSAGCTTCFSGTVSCTLMHCLGECIGGESPACATCRATNCNAAFAVCSGIPAM